MTKTKNPVIDDNPKAVESWDNEGGAPACGDRSSGSTTRNGDHDGTESPRSDIEVRNVEQRPNGRLLYSVCVRAPEGIIEFPIAVQDEGFAPQNEAAALRSTLRLAEHLAESVRRRLGFGNP
jgi:hypothetical protein